MKMYVISNITFSNPTVTLENIKDVIFKIVFVRSENNDVNICTKDDGEKMFKDHSNKYMN